MKVFTVKEYLTEYGQCPFRQWLEKLDMITRARIQARIFRFESGNLGDHKSVGSGVSEARCDFGPGYRIYYGVEAGRIIILLVGGDKRSQCKHIATAQKYWSDWKKGLNHDKKKP